MGELWSLAELVRLQNNRLKGLEEVDGVKDSIKMMVDYAKDSVVELGAHVNQMMAEGRGSHDEGTLDQLAAEMQALKGDVEAMGLGMQQVLDL